MTQDFFFNYVCVVFTTISVISLLHDFLLDLFFFHLQVLQGVKRELFSASSTEVFLKGKT